ncbi:MAG: hypothetical protein V6Z89_09945 [Desulfobacter sp.]
MLGVLGPYVDLGVMVPEDRAGDAEKIVETLLKSLRVLPQEHHEQEENAESTPLETPVKPAERLRPKSMRVAVILGFVLPGTASCYAGRADIGTWILISYLITIVVLSLSYMTPVFPSFPG